MKKKIASMLLCLCMVLTLLPATAAEAALNDGETNFTISGETVTPRYDADAYITEYKITGGGDVTISGEATASRVVIDRDATVTLDNVTMELKKCNGSPLEIAADKKVTLVLKGTNTLDAYARGPGILLGLGAELTIKTDTDTAGTLKVSGAQYAYYNDGKSGELEVSAVGGYGAITGPAGTKESVINNSATKITIQSGTVNAYGYGYGAAIGGDSYSSSGQIAIKGGTVTAISGRDEPGGWLSPDNKLASAIGASLGMPLDSIEIGGNAVVKADGGVSCGAIGGVGVEGHAGRIAIGGNADVTASGASNGAAIGGYSKQGGALNITIDENAKVTANGGAGAPGIGRTAEGAPVTLRIGADAQVYAYSDGETAAIVAAPANGTASIVNIYMQGVDFSALQTLLNQIGNKIPLTLKPKDTGTAGTISLPDAYKAIATNQTEGNYEVTVDLSAYNQGVFQILPYSSPSSIIAAGADAAAYGGTRTMLFGSEKDGARLQRNPPFGVVIYSGNDGTPLEFDDDGSIVVPEGGQVTVSGYKEDNKTWIMTWADGGKVTKGGQLLPNTPNFKFTKELPATAGLYPGQSLALGVEVNEAELAEQCPILVQYRWYRDGEQLFKETGANCTVTEPGEYRVEAFLYYANAHEKLSSECTVVQNYYSGPGNCTLTFDTNGGSAIPALSKAYGTVVDLSAYAPTRGDYTFAGWYSDSKLTDKVSSVKLTGNKTVYAKWIEKLPFTDVAPDAWYYDAVRAAYANGWFAGTTDTTFSPELAMTREMLWTVLGRMDGQALSGPDAFAEARKWAMEKGLTDGSDPTAALTREQLVTIIWRYAGSPKADGDLSAYTDADEVADYAREAFAWAVENGIVTGTGPATLSPKGDATRAQVAAILQRYQSKFGNS